MNVLCEQHQLCPKWTQTLTEISRNKAYDPVTRDYALQHMVSLMIPANVGEPSETDPEKRQAIISALLAAAGQTHESYSGTALQGLHLILQNQQRNPQQQVSSAAGSLAFADDQLRPIAIALAVAEDASMQARITALQVCAERGLSEILPQTREIATAATAPDSLRMSAIAALGRLGTAEDQPLLEQLLQTVSPRLQKAARPALETLKQRAGAPPHGNQQPFNF